eukprot:6192315-Pleurochrysis_carterae.AAC.2
MRSTMLDSPERRQEFSNVNCILMMKKCGLATNERNARVARAEGELMCAASPARPFRMPSARSEWARSFEAAKTGSCNITGRLFEAVCFAILAYLDRITLTHLQSLGCSLAASQYRIWRSAHSKLRRSLC